MSKKISTIIYNKTEKSVWNIIKNSNVVGDSVWANTIEGVMKNIHSINYYELENFLKKEIESATKENGRRNNYQ